MKNVPLSILALALAAAPVLTAGEQPGQRPFAPELTQKIQQLRSQIQAQGLQFQVDVNPAMQYDRDRLCGTRLELMPPEFLAHEPGGYENYDVQAAPAALPGSYVGWFSNPKDQGQCGSCWAFSAAEALEGCVMIKHCDNKQVQVSPQQIADCCTSGGSAGCNGGYPDLCLTWAASQTM